MKWEMEDHRGMVICGSVYGSRIKSSAGDGFVEKWFDLITLVSHATSLLKKTFVRVSLSSLSEHSM